MITFKCKMCGGDLSFEPGASVAECPYCGTNQTLPKLDDDKRANLYDRANHFRRQNEYDKAMAIYEQILAEDRTDAEAYWSLVLCRYGIEYVEDPATHKRVPTVNRAQYASILADEDYRSALKHADTDQRSVYEAEANAIAEIQKGILDISRKEEPFDVFICYKETDANGRRTPDSVLATEMYHELTKEGLKVFFSRITLEDQIGSAYEPYIFAALNSAKVMVVLGTKSEYFNAVWVKNEWSRYLALIRNGADKTLVPAYRDMDPYDLPEEFAHLQAQDMGKLGFMQDLIRGIRKILHKDELKPQTIVQQTTAPASNAAPLVKRAFMSLEDGDFAKADEFCEQALNTDPENARAWLGKLMAQLKVRRVEDLKNQPQPFDGNSHYQKVMRFGDAALKAQLKEDIDIINNRNEHDRQKAIFERASNMLKNATTVDQCLEAIKLLNTIPGFDGVKEKTEAGNARIESIKAEIEISNAEAYQIAMAYKNDKKWGEANLAFKKLGDYRDSQKQLAICMDAQEAERRAKEERRERMQRRAMQKAKAKAAKRRKWVIAFVVVLLVIAAAAAYYFKEFKPRQTYDSAVKSRNEGNYDEAMRLFESLGAYKDASTQVQESQYQKGVALLSSGDYDGATAVFNAISGYNDAATQALESRYQKATALNKAGKYIEAYAVYAALPDYKDVFSIIENDDNIAAAAAWRAQFNAGKKVQFGHYEQDNNTSNGAEAIEWIVLANDGDTATLISNYSLDAKPYNTEFQSITWENCTLRKWLNGDFLDAAFSAEERSRLETVTVQADKNPNYDTDPGHDTQDTVFLLSIDEANLLFSGKNARKCQATAYAKAQDAVSNDNGDSWWWLRSPGNSSDYAANVNNDGSIRDYGSYVNYDLGAVRPVVVVRLS